MSSDNTDLSATCGNYDTGPEKLQNEIADIAKSLGMSDACERIIETANEDMHFEMHAEYEVDALFTSAGGNIGMSTTNSQTENSLNESGCGTALADIKSVVDEKYKIACDLNSNSVSTTIAVNARANINITARASQREMPAYFTGPPPGPQLETVALLVASGAFTGPEAYNIYQAALAAHAVELESYRKREELFAGASIKGRNSYIQNRVSVNMKTLSEFSVDTLSRLTDSSKNIAATVAKNDIAQTTGMASSNSGLSSMVSSMLDSKQAEISETINTLNDSMTMSVDASGNIEIFSDAGIIDLEGAVISNDMAIDMLTKRITEASYDLGKSISSEIIREASSENSTSQETAGFEEVIKAVQEGLASRTAALASAQNEGGDNKWMKYLIILGLLGGGGAIGGSGKMTPIKIMILLAILYLVLAWFFGWFPFNFFSFLSLAFRTKKRRNKSNNLYRSGKKLAPNQSSVSNFVSPRVEYLKRKTPYNNRASLNGTYGGSSIRSRY